MLMKSEKVTTGLLGCISSGPYLPAVGKCGAFVPGTSQGYRWLAVTLFPCCERLIGDLPLSQRHVTYVLSLPAVLSYTPDS